MSKTIISKKIIDKIISGNITVAELESYRAQIDDRFFYIIQTIMKIKDYKIEWADYHNCLFSFSHEGLFDPVAYKDNIHFVCKYINKRKYDYKNQNFDFYNDSFPISFLYSDFEELVSNQYKQIKDNIDSSILKEQQLKKEFNKNYNKIVEQIKNKLTKEELSYITFIKPKK
jgi:hypothetical protein